MTHIFGMLPIITWGYHYVLSLKHLKNESKNSDIISINFISVISISSAYSVISFSCCLHEIDAKCTVKIAVSFAFCYRECEPFTLIHNDQWKLTIQEENGISMGVEKKIGQESHNHIVVLLCKIFYCAAHQIFSIYMEI